MEGTKRSTGAQCFGEVAMAEAEVQAEVKVPVKVAYCGACTLPLEYCEYQDEKVQVKCRKWLEEHPQDIGEAPACLLRAQPGTGMWRATAN